MEKIKVNITNCQDFNNLYINSKTKKIDTTLKLLFHSLYLDWWYL